MAVSSETRTTQLDDDFSLNIHGDANRDTSATIDFVLDYLEAAARCEFRQIARRDVSLNLACSSSVLASSIQKVSRFYILNH